MGSFANIRVLYIEDEPLLCDLFKEAVGSRGYSVDIAPNGKDGLALHAKRPYDLVAIDYQLPDLTGLDIARDLLDGNQDLPVLLITGKGNERIAAEALTLGISDYVIKNDEEVYLELIPNIIAGLLERAGRRQERLDAVSALQQSELRYRTLVSASPVCIHEIDDKGKIISMNPAGLRMMGVDDEAKVCGLKYLDVPVPEDRVRISELMSRALQGDGSTFEFSAVGETGLMHFSSCFEPIINENGKVVKLVGVTQDITDRKAVEEELENQRNRLTAIFDNAPAELYLKDIEGRYVQINRQFEKLFNVRNEDVVGKLPAEVHDPGLGERTRLHDLKVLETGETVIREEDAMTELGPRVLHTIKFPVFDEQGQIEGLGAVVSDITDLKTAEKAVAESEGLLRESAQLAKFGYMVWNCIEERCVSCSDVYAQIHGVSVEEFTSQATGLDGELSFTHPDDRAKIRDATEKVRNGKRAEVEYRLLNPGGEIRYVHSIINPAFDDNGTVIEEHDVLHDVTEQNQSEKALKESEERFRALFQQSPLGITVENYSEVKRLIDRLKGEGVSDFLTYFRDNEEDLADAVKSIRLVDVNDRQIELYGMVSGQEYIKYEQGNRDREDDEWRNFHLHELTAFANGDITYFGEVSDSQADGTPVEIRCVSRIIKSANADWSKVVSTHEDVTERKVAEMALQQSEETLRTFVDHAPALVSLKSITGQYLLMNKEYTNQFGLKPEDDVGKNAHNLFPAEVSKAFELQENEVIETRGDITREHIVPHKDGNHIHLCTKFPVMDLGDDVSAIGTISTDITDRKVAERKTHEALLKAEHANHAKSNFLAHMSHELRTPLNSIIGYSQMVSGETYGKIGNEKYLEYIEDIENSGHHLLDLVNDILDLSKIETGNLTLDESDVDVDELLNSSIRIIRGRKETKSISLQYDPPDSLPHIRADERFVAQIVLNLLSNAVKYNVSDGTVCLSASVDQKNAVTIVVSDTGIGIDATDIPKVLEPFGQARSDSHIAHEGTGLGLSLSRRLAELHGGRLELESQLGRWTTATVVFPSERTIRN